MKENTGYIAGYEAVVSDASTEYVSNFFYSLRKGTDGQWRIAAELFTLNGPAIAKAVTTEQLINDLGAAGIKRDAVLSGAYYFGSRISRGILPAYIFDSTGTDKVLDLIARRS